MAERKIFMIINEKMAKAINDQMIAEIESAYLYASMGAWFDEQDLPGFAHWMKKQASEEMEHAEKFQKYLVSRGARVRFTAIAEPKQEWKSATDVFEDTYAHEQEVTALIYKLADIATELGDYATKSMLTWFFDEQVEEEEDPLAILTKLKKLGEAPMALAMLDAQLGAR